MHQENVYSFLNEVRIGYACGLLTNTINSIVEISYASGYTTLANFHKQFEIRRGCSPLQYLKSYVHEVIKTGKKIGIE